MEQLRLGGTPVEPCGRLSQQPPHHTAYPGDLGLLGKKSGVSEMQEFFETLPASILAKIREKVGHGSKQEPLSFKISKFWEISHNHHFLQA
ncbi:hypothetical protein OsJ_22210 [Oryza sativa Japonica Group]|uniref:Uncharacterized protein n=2 Tax=Oryza TaxID=4527 RepID=A3BE76_ORYSJ|nr:hypothetical protein OsJ_22210 [Oryza sativa Japonica Group]BAD37559.1 hypothetical protein [Oryza sativa Japonica Group]BAD37576.1 hypothetical protein [Oryza sativa Japonica Group]